MYHTRSRSGAEGIYFYAKCAERGVEFNNCMARAAAFYETLSCFAVWIVPCTQTAKNMWLLSNNKRREIALFNFG